MISTLDKNIVLIGFMACGKSHVGRILAQDLGFDLIDLDQIIEKEEGMSIKNIFLEKGEAYFREREYKTLKQFKNSSHMVIVTGGGTPAYFNSWQLLSRIGMVFFLDASFELIKKRLKRSHKRPLGIINTPEEVRSLYERFRFRRPLYLSFGNTINVDKEDSESVKQDIIKRFRAKNNLSVFRQMRVEDAHHPYDIIFGNNVIASINDVIDSIGLHQHNVALVTSKTIEKHLIAVIKNLKLNKAPHLIVINDGEEHKNAHEIERIHEQLFHNKFGRSSLIIALGGGTVGDMVGFAASTFMRGVPIIQIPTTLLSMVDSSVGGKTGIDTKAGKNLIGAFHMPKAVIIDPTLLKTLPKREYGCGMAEVIKHALLGDDTLFYELLKQELNMLEIIERAVLVKARIVLEDPHEEHRRAHLNLGHTFAHALEKASDFTLKHGEAVAIGLILATKLSKRLGLLQEDFLHDLKTLLSTYNLPLSRPSHLDPEVVLKAMAHDKKRQHDGLRFVLPIKLGEVSIERVEEKEVLSVLEQ